MTKHFLITAILILLISKSYSQSKTEVEGLLYVLYYTDNSKNIATRKPAKQIINYGDKVLPTLATYFTDTTQTQIKSECQNFNLTKGEVAIILADRIERMPYALLTGIQNCLMQFCQGNSNLIEYYLDAIRRDGVTSFQKKYYNWLYSRDRKKSQLYLSNKKKNKT